MYSDKENRFKKIKTITNNKTLKYTKTKLKKNKDYLFKIRTYRVVKGKKVFSLLSNMKNVNIK